MSGLTPKQITTQFKRLGHKGPRIICKYCDKAIESSPCKGITQRRINHLQWCGKYLLKTHDFDLQAEKDDNNATIISTEDFEYIKLVGEYDEEPEQIMKILPFM